jgi:hypothetical protein
VNLTIPVKDSANIKTKITKLNNYVTIIDRAIYGLYTQENQIKQHLEFLTREGDHL